MNHDSERTGRLRNGGEYEQHRCRACARLAEQRRPRRAA